MIKKQKKEGVDKSKELFLPRLIDSLYARLADVPKQGQGKLDIDLRRYLERVLELLIDLVVRPDPKSEPKPPTPEPYSRCSNCRVPRGETDSKATELRACAAGDPAAVLTCGNGHRRSCRHDAFSSRSSSTGRWWCGVG